MVTKAWPERVKELRTQMGLSRESFARALTTKTYTASRNSIFNWESGIYTPDSYGQRRIRQLEKKQEAKNGQPG